MYRRYGSLSILVLRAAFLYRSYPGRGYLKSSRRHRVPRERAKSVCRKLRPHREESTSLSDSPDNDAVSRLSTSQPFVSSCETADEASLKSSMHNLSHRGNTFKILLLASTLPAALWAAEVRLCCDAASQRKGEEEGRET